MQDELAVFLLQKQAKLESQRALFESQWREITRFIAPNTGDFSSYNNPGKKRNQEIYDSTALLSARQLVSGIQGYVTSPTERWFELELEDSETPEQDVSAYIQDCTEKMYSVINNPNSGFYSATHEMYSELVPLGTGILFIQEDSKSLVTFKAISLAQCYLDENEKNIIDTLHRRFMLTPRQVLSKFKDAIDAKSKEELEKLIETNSTKTISIVHAVYPRSDYLPDKLDAKNMPFASVYIWEEKKLVLKNSGYKEFPFVCPRWSKRPEEVYGRGPGEEALPDVKMLNKMCKTTINAAEKVVSPPLQLPDDGFLNDIDTSPNALNYYRSGFGESDVIKPIAMSGRVELGLEMEDRRRQQIQSAFYTDLMNNNKKVEQTASEYLGTEESKMRLLGPQMGRLQSEFLTPMLERLFSIMERKKKFSIPPASAQGKNMKLAYSSPLARAQRMVQAAQINRMLEQFGQIAPMFPEILEPINQRRLSEFLLNLHNTPIKILNNKEELQALQEQKQQQQEQANQLQVAEKGSKAAVNLAKVQQMTGGGQDVANIGA
jgi:hypothetical protein